MQNRTVLPMGLAIVFSAAPAGAEKTNDGLRKAPARTQPLEITNPFLLRASLKKDLLEVKDADVLLKSHAVQKSTP